MTNTKIKAPCLSMEPKQYKLFDFVPEFSKFCSSEDYSRFGCDSIDDNLIRIEKRGKIHFENKISICPSCNSSNVIGYGVYNRKLIFLRIGEKICTVQKYKCQKCNKVFNTNLESIIYKNSNITVPVINTIENLYSIFGGSLHKICYMLNKEYNVNISHQSVENILLFSNYHFGYENWSFSGHYLFDSLWVKINAKWNFLLALFDVKLNTLVSIKLVKSEDFKTIYDFLSQSLSNQKRISIVTDLKYSYRDVINKLHFKHQFCRFHAKQKINRELRTYFKSNKLNSEEIETIKRFKQDIFKILDSNSLEIAKNLRDKLISIQKDLPEPLFNILWKFIIPYFKNLTYHLENSNIPATNNRIENIFQKIFPKHIKKKMKVNEGVLKRFMLRLNYWNKQNRNL